MKKKILFITKDQIIKKLIDNGDNISGRIESLLGYDHLNAEKYDKSYINLPRGEVKGVVRRLLHLIEIPFMKITRIGIALEVYPLFKKDIKAADVIFCVTDGIGLGLLFWKRLGFVKAKVIVIMMGLPQKLPRLKKVPFLGFFVKSLLKQAAVITTLSDIAGETLKNYFKLDDKQMKTFHYGTNADFWKPMPEIKKENFILSIGNDSNRDFQTLITAVPENVNLKIITKIPTENSKPQVEILKTFYTGVELQRFYNQSKFIIIPSHKLKEESAGLSSALQIMASGTAVIISRAQALAELFADGVDCLFYEPDNAVDLREKIQTLLDNTELRDKIAESGRQTVLKNFTCQTMSKRLEEILSEILPQ